MPVRGKNGGNAGQGSKWITRKRRLAIYMRDKYRCVWCCSPVGLYDKWCGNTGTALATLDHVLTREDGGSNETHNLVTACMKCNRERGSLDAYAWARVLANRQNFGESPASILWRVLRACLRPLTTRRSAATPSP